MGLLLLFAASCSSSGGGFPEAGATTCPALLRSCPKIVPSYSSVVLPILQANCVVCHSPRGGYGYDESTYAQIHAQQSSILDKVNDCSMPPESYPPLSSTERQALLDWLVCGSPDN